MNYTTNRILEIPQDIKLEIVDGVLILRAGSKVCVPVGFEEDEQTPKFSFITTTRDLSYTEPNQISATFPVYAYYKNGEIRSISRRGNNNSGVTVPSDTYNGAFYNTTTNNVEQYVNDSLPDISSFPLGLVTSVAKEGNNISAIDQIFNGFGYIGSTTFILPGVKWQRCAQSVNYGKNADGTNASVIRSTSSVLLVNHPNTVTSTHYICVSDGGGAARFTSRGSKIVYYDESKNAWYNDYSETYVYIVPLLEEHTTAGRVDSFTPYTVDSVVNSNASNFSQAGKSYLSGLGMPSSRYIDLTLGSSGTTYTAPANGWFWFSKIAGTNLYGVGIENKRNGMIIGSDAGALGSGNAVMPVLAGDNVVVRYSATGKTLGFRFIYAQGNQ